MTTDQKHRLATIQMLANGNWLMALRKDQLKTLRRALDLYEAAQRIGYQGSYSDFVHDTGRGAIEIVSEQPA